MASLLKNHIHRFAVAGYLLNKSRVKQSGQSNQSLDATGSQSPVPQTRGTPLS
jgi:hypothetical protein